MQWPNPLLTYNWDPKQSTMGTSVPSNSVLLGRSLRASPQASLVHAQVVRLLFQDRLATGKVLIAR